MSQSRNEPLKNPNDTPVLPGTGAIDGIAHDIEMSARARKRLVDYFDWLIEAHTLLKREYKKSKESPHDENIKRLLQLHPVGATNRPARSASIKAKSGDQQ